MDFAANTFSIIVSALVRTQCILFASAFTKQFPVQFRAAVKAFITVTVSMLNITIRGSRPTVTSTAASLYSYELSFR